MFISGNAVIICNDPFMRLWTTPSNTDKSDKSLKIGGATVMLLPRQLIV